LERVVVRTLCRAGIAEEEGRMAPQVSHMRALRQLGAFAEIQQAAIERRAPLEQAAKKEQGLD
jgi:hypothetical protein